MPTLVDQSENVGRNIYAPLPALACSIRLSEHGAISEVCQTRTPELPYTQGEEKQTLLGNIQIQDPAPLPHLETMPTQQTDPLPEGDVARCPCRSTPNFPGTSSTGTLGHGFYFGSTYSLSETCQLSPQ